MKLHFAPVQGHTDAPYRHFHAELYGGNYTYYSPFIRLEKGSIRQRDLKDITCDLNENNHIIPQIIFRNKEELITLIKLLQEKGFKEIDLNMGCPFPLQTGHGRGAATITNQDLAKEVVRAVNQFSDISFSIKIRLGLKDPQEWTKLLPFLNEIPLSHITVHPRTASQQYGGEIHLNEFCKIFDQSKNPVVYNGDIRTP